MSIQLLKKNTNSDSSMQDYHKKILKHRLKIAGMTAGVMIGATAVVLGIRIGLEHRTYSAYEVVSSSERSDTMTTKYVEYLNYVLKYGKDGISCVDSSNKLVWSQAYTMQNPIIQICQNSIALAEKNGTQLLIFDAGGLQGTIKTLLPIQQISVSSQGIVAALLEDGDVMRLNLYDKNGEELVESKFELQDSGYPLKMSLSGDASKLAVTFLQVKDGGISTCLAFYNFDSVGENYEDHMVAAKNISGDVIPMVYYMDESNCFAVGTKSLFLYSGKQIPELVKEVPIDREIHSVFYSDSCIGLVVEGQEEKYALQVYDIQGKLKFETEFTQDYKTLKFSGNSILIYNEFECMILNQTGTIVFNNTFEESISNMYTLSGNRRYVVMHAAKTDLVRLK